MFTITTREIQFSLDFVFFWIQHVVTIPTQKKEFFLSIYDLKGMKNQTIHDKIASPSLTLQVIKAQSNKFERTKDQHK